LGPAEASDPNKRKNSFADMVEFMAIELALLQAARFRFWCESGFEPSLRKSVVEASTAFAWAYAPPARWGYPQLRKE
jgi:hypothetical protein